MTAANQPALRNAPENMLAVAGSREMQEVQAAIFLARQFPRSIETVEKNLMAACSRFGLAEQAMYAYPRGTELVTGPSIRLAEAIAQSYQNLSFGIRELKQEGGESIVQAFAWDMENNVRQEKIFSVQHMRKTKRASYRLDDPRDIYELVANNGARRLRACILGVIPGDIVDKCIKRCEETLKKGTGDPLPRRIEKMLAAFDELGVSKELIEKRLCHKAEVTNETELMQLAKIYKSLNDGMSKPGDFFAVASAAGGAAADLNAEYGAREPGEDDE